MTDMEQSTIRPKAGPRAPRPVVAARRTPRRRCIATGDSREQADLLRFVVAPDGALTFDLTGKLPGRGLWVSAHRPSLKRAIQRKLFARAARSAVKVPENLEAMVESALRRRCLELIGLANRAGLATCGFEKVRSGLSADGAAILLQATDAADDGRDKIAALAHAAAPEMPIFRLLSAHELGGLFGRDHVVHVMLRPGGLADKLAGDLRRLQGLLAFGDDAQCGATNPAGC